MARFNFLKRLVKEDFKKNDQDLIGRIAFVLNPALEAITSAMSNNLTFEDNFASQVKEVELEVDSSGIPTTSVSFKSTLRLPCKNIIVTRAENLTNTNIYPSNAPFISFSDVAGQIFILHVTGLQANNNYKLRIIATN